MAQTIDETLSDDVEAHKQATSLRLAFESEAAKVRCDIQQDLHEFASYQGQSFMRSELSMEFVYDVNEGDGEPNAQCTKRNIPMIALTHVLPPVARAPDPDEQTPPPNKRSRPFVPFVSPMKGSEK